MSEIVRTAPARRPSTRFLTRYVLPSDNHGFVGRVYDLSILAYHFDTYAELAKHADCKYAIDVNEYVSILARRVETLNLVGNMLWPNPFPAAKSLPISFYEWLTACADVFLTRFISVVDCSLLLVNCVYEAGLTPVDCRLKKLKQAGVSAAVIDQLGVMLDEQARLRSERNARIHEGRERDFTQDDQTFQIAARFELGSGMRGKDRNGRPVEVTVRFVKVSSAYSANSTSRHANSSVILPRSTMFCGVNSRRGLVLGSPRRATA